MEEDDRIICGTCKCYHEHVRDSEKTGAAFDARTCGHHKFKHILAKCPGYNEPGCLLHSKLEKTRDEKDLHFRGPYLAPFDDCLRGATNMHSFMVQLKRAIDVFFDKCKEAEYRHTNVPSKRSTDLSHCVGFALMELDFDPLRVEFNNIINSAMEAYIQPAFEESHKQIGSYLDTLIGQIEQRYAPLVQEVEDLKRELKELKDENADSVGPALRVAVKD